jgi:hypothetical protein
MKWTTFATYINVWPCLQTITKHLGRCTFGHRTTASWWVTSLTRWGRTYRPVTIRVVHQEIKPQISSPWTTLISESLKFWSNSQICFLHLTPPIWVKEAKETSSEIIPSLLHSLERLKKKFFCVRRESNPGPIETVQEIGNLLEWQRWILPLNHKRFLLELMIGWSYFPLWR